MEVTKRCRICAGPMKPRYVTYCSLSCKGKSNARPRELRNNAIQVSDGRWTLVDRRDLAFLRKYSWNANKAGYVTRGGHYPGPMGMHRIILSRMLGRDLESNELADHKNGNPLDNRRSNIRLATKRQNIVNQQNRKRPSSGYFGVTKSPGRPGWRGYAAFGGRQYTAGYSRDPEELAWMRDQWVLALHGEFAILNFKYVEVPRQ